MSKSTTIHVAADGDEQSDGSTPALAVRTPARASALLAGGMGAIQMGAGPIDPGPNGIVLVEGQLLLGDGYGTQIDGTKVTQGGAVVSLTGSRSIAREFAVANVPAWKTGVRTTWVPGIASNENSRLENLFVDARGQYAVAYGVGDDTANDVSELEMRGCDSVGNNATSIHMLVGNGQTGNVADCRNFGGNSQCHAYAIVWNGGALTSEDLNRQYSQVADYWFKQAPVGNAVARGGRSENSKRLAIYSFGGVNTAIAKIADTIAVQLSNTDGEAVQMSSGPLILDNVEIAGAICPQFVSLIGRTADGPTMVTLDATNVTSDHVHAFRTQWSRPGKVIRARGTRFVDRPSFSTLARHPESLNVRRANVKTSAAYTIDPATGEFDHVEIRLGADAGVCTLTAGTAGQRLRITIEQDGVGGRIPQWPPQCAFDGGVKPAPALAPHARQSIEFECDGEFWLQVGAVTTVVRPTAAPGPFVADFAQGSRFWLPAPWEHLAGGGSIGVSGGVAVCNSVGWVGDNYTDARPFPLGGEGAAAVVETGMALADVTATFVWQRQESLILRYRDDHNFIAIALANNASWQQPYLSPSVISRGVAYNAGVAVWNGAMLTPGSTHTLGAKMTAAGLALFVDGVQRGNTFDLSRDEFRRLGEGTRHGIILSDTGAKCSAFAVGIP
jgi:hypothetical protein